MGLQHQLSDVSSESIIILTVVLVGKSVRYLRSILDTIFHSLGLISHRFDSDHPNYGSSPYDVVGSGLAGVILLCEQEQLNPVCSYSNQSGDGVGRFGSNCVVCQNQFVDGDNLRKLACRHVFHKDCFDGWLQHLNFNCPLCRAQLVSDECIDYTRRRVAGNLLSWFTFE